MPRTKGLLLLALCLPLPLGAQGNVPGSTEQNGTPVVAGLGQAEPLPQPIELKAELPQFRPSTTIAEAFAASQEELKLRSAVALVIDQEDGQLLYAKNTDAIMPIASITKLMSAVVVLDAKLPLDEPVTITRDDVDTLKGTRSRLKLGVTLPRRDMLRLALMASENRAAAALARAYPGDGRLRRRHESEGPRAGHARHPLRGSDRAPIRITCRRALDLAMLVNTGTGYPADSRVHYSRVAPHRRRLANGRKMQFSNSNRLVRNSGWDIGLSKTGYISEAGRCLVMQAQIAATPVIIVLLDSWGQLTRIADANRIKKWIERLEDEIPTTRHRARMM